MQDDGNDSGDVWFGQNPNVPMGAVVTLEMATGIALLDDEFDDDDDNSPPEQRGRVSASSLEARNQPPETFTETDTETGFMNARIRSKTSNLGGITVVTSK